MADESLRTEADEDVLKTARNEIAKFHDLEQKVLEGAEVPESVKAGCSIELGHKDLVRLPEELIDVIKDDAERLALNQNRLSGLSGLASRFSECTRLRYLVLRSNVLREFPAPILDLPSLELLDLKNNKIEALPEDLSRLRNLRVLSIRHNRISKVPLCIGNMGALAHFATRSNPIVFPPKHEWVVTSVDSDDEDKDRDRNMHRDKLETQKLKKLLLEYAVKGKLRAETESELSDSNVVTPKPARRKASGRFPIRPSVSNVELNGTGIPSSPLPPKAPPLPSKSISRSPVQPQTAVLRPPIAPLITNERNRSNSESQMSTSVRAKRRGFVTRKTTAPGILEMKQNNRLSHLRGLSHGSALQANNSNSALADPSSPTTPVEGENQRDLTMRRLSSLPEGRRKSGLMDSHVQLARDIHFVMDEARYPIDRLLKSIFEETTEFRTLAKCCSNAFRDMDHLGVRLREFDRLTEENDEMDRAAALASVQETCLFAVEVWELLGLALRNNIHTLVSQGRPQFVRSLMNVLYSCLVETRNACARFGVEVRLSPPRTNGYDPGHGRFVSPVPNRPATSFKVRSPLANGGSPETRRRFAPATKVFTLNEASRSPSSNSLAEVSGHTLDNANGSNHSAARTISRSHTMLSLEEADEEDQFEKIYTKLQTACTLAYEVLPRCYAQFSDSRRQAMERIAAESEILVFEDVCERCKSVMDAADALNIRLHNIRVRDSTTRNKPDFWQLCTGFTRAYYIFVGQIKDLAPRGLVSDEIKPLLKPLQTTIKASSRLISDSPWSHLAVPPGSQPVSQPPTRTHSRNPSTTMYSYNPPFQQHRQRGWVGAQPQLSLQTKTFVPPPNPMDPQSATSVTSSQNSAGVSSGYVTPLPATPLSAALGPAAQATVPVNQVGLQAQSVGFGAYFGNNNAVNTHGHGLGVERSRSVSQQRREWRS